MPKSVSTRSAYKMLTCIYLCRTLLFFAPYADFLDKRIQETYLQYVDVSPTYYCMVDANAEWEKFYLKRGNLDD